MADDSMDGDDVYTVIPTAPEDIPPFDPASLDTSSPLPTANKMSPRPPNLTFTGRPSNGSTPTTPFNHMIGSNVPHPGRSGHKSNREGGKRKDGLPSHAFSRNYYCRFCSFNTTKSKVHLYHLVDVHGVDYKIFSCDRCDYASRWKCKVIRHRKMIHKINEPKFEPEVHDSRSQTGKRPPPAVHLQQQQQAALQNTKPTIPDNGNHAQAQAAANQAQVAAAAAAFLSVQSLPNNQLPSFIPPFTQSPQLAGHPINPFVNKTPTLPPTAVHHKPNRFRENGFMMSSEKEETKPSYLSASNLAKTPPADNSASRRKQRKPQNVRKVVKDGDDEVYEAVKLETDTGLELSGSETVNSDKKQGENDEDPSPLFGLFGSGGLDDSGNSGGILSGPSWRRRLMPTAVTMTSASEKQSTSPPSSDPPSSTKTSPNNNILKPSSSQLSIASSHSNTSNSDPHAVDDNDDGKDKGVEEIMIDEEPHFRCTECNFISKFRWKTSKHYKSNHNTSKQYSCSSCEYTTLNRVDFFSHKASHSSRLDQMNRQHQFGRFAHPMMVQGMHKCEECGYIASSKTNLDRHMQNHRSNNPIKCLYCTFSSTGEAAIQRHMAEHHDQSEIPITMRKQFQQQAEMDIDNQDEGMLNGDGEFNCELCGYTARNWSKMKEHMIRHSEGTPFACSYCDSKYKRPADLNRHLKIKHNTCLADIGLDGPTLKGVMGSFPSPGMEDNAGGGDNSGMKRPYPLDEQTGGDSDNDDDPKRLCIDEEGVNLQCPRCSYVAKWKSDLERHMKVHSEEKRFGCSTCFKSYKYQGDLNVHMRKAHAAGHIRSPHAKQPGSASPGSGMSMPPSMSKTPPPNVQVLSNEVIVNMSHAAIVNPLANLGPPMFPMSGGGSANQSTHQQPQPQQQAQLSPQEYQQMPQLSGAPQMPMLKPAPNMKSPANGRGGAANSKDIKLNSDGKPIKKGELDPSTMIHVPGGEFKCLNCCYETNFKSHLDAHMRLHPEKPFHCKFCNYASYWRGDTKKHIEKNHPEKLPEGINPYNLVEQVFEEAVKNSPHRHKPLPEVHNLPSKSDSKLDKGRIWTPPSGSDNSRESTPATELKIPTLSTTSSSLSPSTSGNKSNKSKEESGGGSQSVQCPHCAYSTSSESRLNAHMATHYNLKIFKCPECGKRANWKWDIQKHMRTDHPGKPENVVVMDTEEARESLDEYLKQHPEQRGKPKIGVSADYRPEHWPKPRVGVTNTPPASSSSRTKSYTKDMTTSSKTTSIRPFRCSICARRSNWKCDIRKHYRQVHPGRHDARVELMTKEELLEAGEKEDDIDQHYPEMKNGKPMVGNKPFKCSLCGKSSRWKWDVAKHIKMVHKGITEAHVVEDEEAGADVDQSMDSDPGTPDTSITDGEGENSLTQSPSLLKHRASPDVTVKAKPNGPKIGCYQCSVCSQFSEFMWVIRRHIRSLHSDNPDAKIVDLSSKGDDAAHSDSRPYICSLCGKRSNWKWDVKKHILSVHRGTIGSILDEQLSKETVIYTDGKTMEVDDGNTADKIAEIQSHLKEEGVVPQSTTPTPQQQQASSGTTGSSSNFNNNCYSSLPTMVGLQSAIAPSPDPSSQGELSNGAESTKSSPAKSELPSLSGEVKFKCGYCFYTSTSRTETVKHEREEHPGKILRIQTLNKTGRDEQTTYKAAHRASTASTISMWQCSQCSFKHIKKEEALMHLAQHDLYNAYQCAICDFADDMEYTLHKHIKTKHDVESIDNVMLHNIMFTQCSEENDTPTGVSYSCNQCDMKTAWRSAIVRHIKEKHVIDDEIYNMFTKHGASRSEATPGEQSRRYNCSVCPYRTDKVSMFNEHMERHSPKSGSDLKCPYCEYWVPANRLLHQHIRLHQQDNLAAANAMSMNGDDSKEKFALTGGLAQCPDCPYRGKTKDLNAHRRLHKQRPGAVYKCPECPYWVNHNRLLQQHAKVHSPRYRQKVYQNDVYSLGDTSMEDVAAFKQHLINSQVTSVKLEPNSYKRKQLSCHQCPFATSQQAKLTLHISMHGAYSDGALKCKFCDFYCESRELMAQHIKVHSLQYQGELDDGSVNGDEDSADDGEITESSAGFNLRFSSDQGLSLEKQKRGVTSRKFCCEKCSYCSANKDNFRRHMSLHGSKQGYTCGFCDYSVPTADLLKPHEQLHTQPNRNLLATQSIMNLTKLKPVSADVQLAHSAEIVDGSVTDVHDHLNLYENIDSEQIDQPNGSEEGMDDDGEPEFIDLAELGSKVTSRSPGSAADDEAGSVPDELSAAGGMEDDEESEMEDGEELWICRFCDRAFDSEVDLTAHEKQHS